MNSVSTIAKPSTPRKRTGFYFLKPDGTERRLKSKPHVKLTAAAGIYEVRSDSDHTQWHKVDAVNGTCDCAAPAGCQCWHVSYLSYLFAPKAPALPEPIDMQTWQPRDEWVTTQWGRYRPAPPELTELYEPTARRARRTVS